MKINQQRGTDLTPIFYSKLNTVLQPENGETPISFVFQFDADIDEAALTADMISVVRKDFLNGRRKT